MPDRLILGFDTSAAHCAAALLRGDRVLVARHEDMAKGQAERLMVLCEEVLDEAGASWSDLDLIGVGTGPGNFTGIRISVAAARGLALSLGIPAVGVAVPEALALGRAGPATVVQDARGGRLYVQAFDAEGPQAPVALVEADVPLFDGPVIGTDQAAEALAVRVGRAFVGPRWPLAVAIARIAALRGHSPHDRPAPIYVRPPDAAPARDAGPRLLP